MSRSSSGASGWAVGRSATCATTGFLPQIAPACDDRLMEEPFRVELADGREARAVRVHTDAELADAVERLGIGGRAALVVVGGASGLSGRDSRRLAPLFSDILAPLAQRLRATVVDGGTGAGGMRLMGDARGEGGASFPLIGVIVDELVDSIGLEPNH